MVKNSMVQKSVRLPQDLIDFVEQQPGKDFSKKLLGILTECRDGALERQLMLQRYDEQIAERRNRLDTLMQKINSLSMISRRVDALISEVDTAEK